MIQSKRPFANLEEIKSDKCLKPSCDGCREHHVKSTKNESALREEAIDQQDEDEELYATTHAKACECREVYATPSRTITIDYLKSFIAPVGKCLAEPGTHVTSKTLIPWQCHCGNKFIKAFQDIRYNHVFCRKCRARKDKYTIQDMHRCAAAQRGRCLTQQYVDDATKCKFQCACGHKFSLTPNAVVLRAWCRRCCYTRGLPPEVAAKYYAQLQAFAAQRNGKCLSKTYINNRTKRKFQCQEGHTWWAYPLNVIHHLSWCPKCNDSVSEEIARQILERLLNCKTIKARYDWMQSAAGRSLELDCRTVEKVSVRVNNTVQQKYVALEYQGRQHYEPIYGQTQLEQVQRNDAIKVDECSKNDIVLLVVPFTVSHKHLASFISNLCDQSGVVMQSIGYIDISTFRLPPVTQRKYEDTKRICEERGWLLLDQHYVAYDAPLSVRCDKRHEFPTCRDYLVMGRGCPVCYNHYLDDLRLQCIDKVKQLAEKHNAEWPNPNEYQNRDSKLNMMCRKHKEKVTATSSSLQAGHFNCKKCVKEKQSVSHAKITEAVVRNFAKSERGDCLGLSSVPGNEKRRPNQRIYDLVCKHYPKHPVFQMSWAQLNNKSRKRTWCPECQPPAPRPKRGKYDMSPMTEETVNKVLAAKYVKYIGDAPVSTLSKSTKLPIACLRDSTHKPTPKSFTYLKNPQNKYGCSDCGNAKKGSWAAVAE